MLVKHAAQIYDGRAARHLPGSDVSMASSVGRAVQNGDAVLQDYQRFFLDVSN